MELTTQQDKKEKVVKSMLLLKQSHLRGQSSEGDGWWSSQSDFFKSIDSLNGQFKSSDSGENLKYFLMSLDWDGGDENVSDPPPFRIMNNTGETSGAIGASQPDLLKSIDSIIGKFKSSDPGETLADFLRSLDWDGGEGNVFDPPVSQDITTQMESTAASAATIDWKSLYDPFIPDPQPQSVELPMTPSAVFDRSQCMNLQPKPTSLRKLTRTKRKRHSTPCRYKRDPHEIVYCTPTDRDVLCGRGGRSNHHFGNKMYLRMKDEIQGRYLAATKFEKTAISQELVDMIHSLGGRFLEQVPETDHWFEITELKARKKASQSLREINTPELRKAKRERYGRYK